MSFQGPGTGLTGTAASLSVGGSAGSLSTTYTAGRILYGAGSGVPTTVSTFFYDSANGRVGIGTASPVYTLDVSSFAVDGGTIRIASSSSCQFRMMEANDSYGFSFTNVAASRLSIKRHSASVDGTEIISIMRDNPFVGIGITPLCALDVNGTIRCYNNYNGPPYYIISENAANAAGAYAIYYLSAGGSSCVWFKNSPSRNDDGGANTATLRNDAGKLRLMANSGAGITIDGANVGIGTNNPGSILNVYSTVASPSSSIVTIGNVTTGYGAGNGDQTSVSCLYTSLGNGNNIVHQIGRTNDTNSFFYGYQHNTGSPWWWVAKYGVTNQAFTVNANGVGIGCTHTNTAFKMQVSNGDSSSTLYGPNTTWGAYLNVGTGSTYCGSNRASVNCSNGNLHIDCATGGYQIYLNYFQGGGGVNATIGCYGAVVATGDITAFASDERLKTKVGLIENALDKVCSLTAFKYIHNDVARANGFTDDKVYVGLSAQEVQKVLPEVVKPAPFDQGTEYDVGLGKSKSGENYLTIQYERIVSLLVESIKEERKAREAVTCELRSLEERIKLLEQK